MDLQACLLAVKEKRIPFEAFGLLALWENWIHDGKSVTIYPEVKTLHTLSDLPPAIIREALKALEREGFMRMPEGYLKRAPSDVEATKEVDAALACFDKEYSDRLKLAPPVRVWARDRKMMKDMLRMVRGDTSTLHKLIAGWVKYRADNHKPITVPLLYSSREIVYQKHLRVTRSYPAHQPRPVITQPITAPTPEQEASFKARLEALRASQGGREPA